MKAFRTCIKALVVAAAMLLIAQSAFAYVQVRISIKFILDAGDNRPATGNLNDDAEINGEVDWGNKILAANNNMSELRLYQVELIDLKGVSQWYSACPTATNRDNLRAAAIANPSTYRWRTNAVNIYINGACSGCSYGAISDFPPDNNNMILMSQCCSNTPSCILHELGHSLDLLHTHQGGGADGCADTIADNENWSRDQIAQNNFGTTYDKLTAAQKDQVDLVFNNVMSYHVSEPQLRFSVCQLDRASGTADDDRAWLLVKQPVYVKYTHTGTQDGRFDTPYKTLQAAEAAGLSNRVLVLHKGDNPITTAVTIDENTQIVPRLGTATVGNGALLYTIPTDLEESETPEVRDAIKAARSEAKEARKTLKDAEKEAETAPTEEDKAAIIAKAKEKKKQHEKNVLEHLRDAEIFAVGEEKVAIELEIAQRLRDSGNCSEAIDFFNLVAENTEQIHLRERALLEVQMCQMLLEGGQQGEVSVREEMDTGETWDSDKK